MAHRHRRIERTFQFLLLFLVSAAPCLGQDSPSWEFFGGYSFQHAQVREYFRSSPTIYSIRNQSVGLHGWDLSVTENLNSWFGGTMDLSGYYGTPQLLGVSNRQRRHLILYGPQISQRRARANAFAHVLAGVAHSSVKVIPTGPNASEYSFAIAAGGGLDLSLGAGTALRVIQVDYFWTRALGAGENNFRASTGVVFYLGRR